MDRILELIAAFVSAINRIGAALEKIAERDATLVLVPVPDAPAPAPVPDTPAPVPDPAPTPDPAPVPVPDPDPVPTPVPDPAPVPDPTPDPVDTIQPGYRAPQDFNIDRNLSFNWGNPDLHVYLPTWRGGDRQNGVGGSLGMPRRVIYNADKSVQITAGMETMREEGVDVQRWCTGAMQLHKPTAALGKWGIDVTGDTGTSVNAFFAHASNQKELDFELVKRDGVVGWQPGVHMPRTGGGRASNGRRQMALGRFVRGVRQRLEFELFADRVEFSIDGAVFETVRHADMDAGYIWDTTTRMGAFATIERHQNWAGWDAADYAREARMTVHGFLLPVMP